MDKQMVDTEDQREDRKYMDSDFENPLLNRRERRKMAKRRGLFKTEFRGSWKQTNRTVMKQKPVRRNKGDHGHGTQI